MLFDLSGKRKRFIQVIYAALAGLFAISFVGFGIGSEAGVGGIFDAVGLGGNNSGTDPGFEEDIEKAKERLEKNPKDRAALLELADTYSLVARDALETDDQGRPLLTDEAVTAYNNQVDAWERYLKTDPSRVDTGAATQALDGYLNVWATSQRPSEFEDAAESAVETARRVATEEETANSVSQLAIWLYRSGDEEAAEEAAKRALEVADPSLEAQLEAQFDLAERQGKAVARFIREAGKQGADDILNPLDDSALGGDPLGTP